MKVVALRHPAGLDALKLEDRPSLSPGRGQVRVRWRASSLNFHDFSVVVGLLPAVDGRIPMSDGAGEVLEVGEGVSAWRLGDRVLSLFFPDWQDAAPDAQRVQRMTGDSAEGCACEESVVAETALTRMPNVDIP
jgi:NADPH:quinone reductase-like Zn-dependent oxidoreductase